MDAKKERKEGRVERREREKTVWRFWCHDPIKESSTSIGRREGMGVDDSIGLSAAEFC